MSSVLKLLCRLFKADEMALASKLPLASILVAEAYSDAGVCISVAAKGLSLTLLLSRQFKRLHST